MDKGLDGSAGASPSPAGSEYREAAPNDKQSEERKRFLAWLAKVDPNMEPRRQHVAWMAWGAALAGFGRVIDRVETEIATARDTAERVYEDCKLNRLETGRLAAWAELAAYARALTLVRSIPRSQDERSESVRPQAEPSPLPPTSSHPAAPADGIPWTVDDTAALRKVFTAMGRDFPVSNEIADSTLIRMVREAMRWAAEPPEAAAPADVREADEEEERIRRHYASSSEWAWLQHLLGVIDRLRASLAHPPAVQGGEP